MKDRRECVRDREGKCLSCSFCSFTCSFTALAVFVALSAGCVERDQKTNPNLKMHLADGGINESENGTHINLEIYNVGETECLIQAPRSAGITVVKSLFDGREVWRSSVRGLVNRNEWIMLEPVNDSGAIPGDMKLELSFISQYSGDLLRQSATEVEVAVNILMPHTGKKSWEIYH